jgi:hypothetical protein
MNVESTKEEERLESFYKALFGIDSAAMVFFLIVKPGPTLPTTLPFTLGPFIPFKCEVIMLAALSTVTLIARATNLLTHSASRFLWLRVFAWFLLVLSIAVIACGGIAILRNPGYLPPR